MNKNFKSLFFENTGIRQTIFKNTFWLACSELITKGLIFVLTILIVRYLGIEIFGKFSFAFAFVAFFSVFADCGLITLTTREVAKNTILAKKYIDNIIVIKFILGIVAFGALALSLQFLDKSPDVKQLVLLAGIWIIVYSFTQFFQSIFRGFEQMEYEALSKVIYSFSLCAIILYLMFLGAKVDYLVVGYIAAALIGFIFTLFLVIKRFAKFWVEVDFSFWKYLFKEAWPFAVFIIFAVIYFQIAMVMLSIIKTDRDVGLYSVAFNSVVIFLILAEIITGSALPTLSKIASQKGLFRDLTKKLITVLIIISSLLTAFLFFGSEIFIKLIYGKEFIEAVPAFKIMVLILPFRFMNYLFGVSLIAANLQKSRLNAAIICAFFNVLINLMLIPRFGFIGAAVATLATEIILFFLYFFSYKKAVKLTF